MSLLSWPPNFTLAELIYSQTAKRLGIPNMPTQGQAEKLREMATNVLQPARNALGRIRVTSGYRSPTLNASLGGTAKRSDHMATYKGDVLVVAADVVAIDVTNLLLFRWLWVHVPWSRLIWEYGGAWVHVSYGEDRKGRTPLRTGDGPNEAKYIPLAMEPGEFNG